MSNNNTLNGGYTRLDSQAETTGKGPFDLRNVLARKQMAARGENQSKCYPNADDINLGTIPGEFLVYKRALRNTSRSGARSVAVFSSFNGFWWGRYECTDAIKRDYAIAGVCKTLYNLPGAPSTASARGSDYQTDSGIAWLESGSISASRNTGTETIRAGQLVMLDLPPTSKQLSGSGSFFLSPNNPNGGMPLGKYVLVTRPFHAEDQVGHLMTISGLLRRSHSQQTSPGILNVPFADMHFANHRPGSSILSDNAKEAGTCYDYTYGVFFTVFEELLNKALTTPDLVTALNGVVAATVNSDGTAKVDKAVAESNIHMALKNLFNVLKVVDRTSANHLRENYALDIFDYVLQQHNSQPSRRKRAMDAYARRNGLSPGQAPPKTNEAAYAHLTQSPLSGLYTSFTMSAAHQNAWVVGRAMADSEPGE